MRVIVCRPNEKAVIEEIGKELKDLQKMVGGYIEIIYPSETACIVLNEEGKLINLAPCRELKNDDGEVYDVIVGTFFICGFDIDGELADISPEDEKKFLAEFGEPCAETTPVPEPYARVFTWG